MCVRYMNSIHKRLLSTSLNNANYSAIREVDHVSLCCKESFSYNTCTACHRIDNFHNHVLYSW